MYQQITIVGNIGREPELRYTQSGVAVCDFSVAVNKRFTNQQTGEKQDVTTWFKVSAWRELAEVIAPYIKKGRQVLVIGEVKATAYMDKSGQPAAALELNATTIRVLGGRDDEESHEEGQGNAPRTNQAPPQQRQAPPVRSNRAPQRDDDIPF